MATKKQAAKRPIFIARQRRSEIDGGLYDIGDKTPLEGLNAAQIGFVVGKGYYSVEDYSALSDAQAKEVEKYKG